MKTLFLTLALTAAVIINALKIIWRLTETIQNELAITSLRRQIKSLKSRLRRIANFLTRSGSEAQDILSQPSGVPRPRWAYSRGQDKATRYINQ